MLRALDADRAGGTSRRSLIISSGVMWSQETKQACSAPSRSMMLIDSFGSSEAVGLGAVGHHGAGGDAETATFQLGPTTRVFTDDGRWSTPGSGETGLVAVGGPQPVGYYKDPEKTRRDLPHDRRPALLDPRRLRDGRGRRHASRLLGRGSVCINTGGEKVFPEEVEEALKTAPPTCATRWWSACPTRGSARRSPPWSRPSGDALDAAEVIAHVKTRLAAYKAPKHVVVDTIGRAANGKVDYKRCRTEATNRWWSCSSPP